MQLTFWPEMCGMNSNGQQRRLAGVIIGGRIVYRWGHIARGRGNRGGSRTPSFSLQAQRNQR